MEWRRGRCAKPHTSQREPVHVCDNPLYVYVHFVSEKNAPNDKILVHAYVNGKDSCACFLVKFPGMEILA